jgi:hypothetical protein
MCICCSVCLDIFFLRIVFWGGQVGDMNFYPHFLRFILFVSGDAFICQKKKGKKKKKGYIIFHVEG